MDDKEEGINLDLLSSPINAKLAAGHITDRDECDGTIQETVCCSQRWVLAFMVLWVGIMAFMLNANMNIAIVCMVKSGDENIMKEDFVIPENFNITLFNYTISNAVDAIDVTNVSTIKNVETDDSCQKTAKTQTVYSERAEFVWDKKTQSVVLSSFYYGYLVMQIPGGLLATRFGGKYVIGTSMIVASVFTLLMPVLARTSVYLVVVARAILGLCLGTTSPSICGLISTWALPVERSRMLGMCWFGLNVGAVIGYSTSGLLCVHGFDNGWASIFYIQGVIGLVFVSSWWFAVYSSPQTHPRISVAERHLILQHLDLKPKQKENVPWKFIFSYVPVYVVFITHMCDAWTYYLLVTCLPLFLKEVLKFDIESLFFGLRNSATYAKMVARVKEIVATDARYTSRQIASMNGLFSCLPYITFMAGIAFAGVFADLFRSWQSFSITTIRKVFQLASFIGVAVFLLIPGYLTYESRYGVIVCLCLCTFFEAIGITGGHLPNILDIAPRYSSLIFGVSNTIATIPGIIAPMTVAVITKTGTSEEWRVVFFISVGITVFASFVYGFFADSELAPWAIDKNHQNEIEVKLSNESVTDEFVPNGV